jgi:hypothetical protein
MVVGALITLVVTGLTRRAGAAAFG